ncbi:S-adenosyl-L-methionine-dependent methyltransferase [Infundibulicybe gibba]|nr:S-adenosyl-L-methionine-dependent methyltransferase [Infundibulicybe gibba]
MSPHDQRMPIVRTNREKVQDLLKTITAAAQDAMNVYDSAGYDVPCLDSPVQHPIDTALDAIVPLKLAMRVLETACEEICTTLANPAHTIGKRMVMGFEPACLRVVSNAGVADVLSSSPSGVHVGEISKRTGLEESRLARMMRLLASRRCFREVEPDVFANNRLSQNLLSANPVSATVGIWTDDFNKGMAALHHALHDPEYASTRDPGQSPFMYAVQDEITNSKGVFDWYALHPEKQKRFGRGMIGLSAVTGALAVLKSPVWKALDNNSSVCDVGAGVGSFTIKLAQEHPHLKITLCDLPEVVKEAEKASFFVEKGRVEFLPVDFFKEIPEGRDVYYARHIVHAWHDPGALVILKNIRKAMRRDSKLLIHEFVCPSPCSGGRDLSLSSTQHASKTSRYQVPVPNLLYNMDMTMLVMVNSKERTLADFINLGMMADLELREITDFAEMHLLEFRVADADRE